MPSDKLETPWARPAQEVAQALEVDADEGLSPEEVRERRRRFGENRLRGLKRRSAWEILIEQFKSVIVGLLAAAAVLSFAFGELVEGGAILVVILINALIGFVTELRAVRSMEALQELSQVNATVRRQGKVEEIPAEEVVVGDITVFQGGDVVTADTRLLEASKLQANESALTGESVPVSKQTEPTGEDVPLAERSSMLYKGTAVTRGSGSGVVVSVGMETELGHISSLVEEAHEEETPLERRLQQLGNRLIWVTLGIAVLVAISGILAGRDLMLMIRSAIALAVASVPEGLPIVATVALARGMWRMARRQAVVNRLSAVETLGSTTVVLTDKTGTLTENRMTVTQVVLPMAQIEITGEGLETEGEFRQDDQTLDPSDHDRLREMLQVAILCNNATLQDADSEEEVSSVGEPTEVALLVAGAKAGLLRDDLVADLPEVREVAFDPEVRMMATFHELGEDPSDLFPNAAGPSNGYLVAVKGATEAVLDASTRIRTKDGTDELTQEMRDEWVARSQDMAQQGLRMMAMADKTVSGDDEPPYEELTFLGLMALLDPPREEVRDSIKAAQRAGMDVIMITGDQADTARNIAKAVGLVEDADAAVVHGSELGRVEEMDDAQREKVLSAAIFARVSPAQKLDLIALHQEAGEVVAMTGDGVNDAPALKKADIGVAMGQRGTEVAREAADMVLKDDRFSTIVVAVEQGRTIFNNIRKFVLYLLSCNVAEILIVGLASLINAPLPILPLQILFLNLVTDVFPALALGVGEGDPAIMRRPPRDPSEPILARRHWLSIAGYSSLITVAVLGSLGAATLWLGMEEGRAVTVSFLTLAFAQLWHVFNMRDVGTSLLRNQITENKWIWGALALCTGLLLLVVYVPGLADILQVERPGAEGWALIAGASLAPYLIGQIIIQIRSATSQD